MAGDKTGGVSVKNLLYLMLIIRGAKMPAREEDLNLDDDTERMPGILGKISKVDEIGQFVVGPGG